MIKIRKRKSIKNINIQKINQLENVYSEKENFFDPSKQSPPNDFLLKLQKRMMNYNLGIK